MSENPTCQKCYGSLVQNHHGDMDECDCADARAAAQYRDNPGLLHFESDRRDHVEELIARMFAAASDAHGERIAAKIFTRYIVHANPETVARVIVSLANDSKRFRSVYTALRTFILGDR